MRRWPVGALFALCLFWGGCDTDVPSEEVKSALDDQSICVLTGGIPTADGFCQCGKMVCGEKVNCRKVDDELSCGGIGYTFLTEGLCTMIGVEVCTERIGTDGLAVGYFTKCGDDNRWTVEQPCDGNNSCMLYKFGFAMSSKCGECQNNGTSCIGGVRQQ